MDAKVDDFFNEINQIAPPKKDENKSVNDWEECYDEQSGYTYYWNIKTNEVSWDTPAGFTSIKSRKKVANKKGSPSIPTRLTNQPKHFPLSKGRKVNDKKAQALKKSFKTNSDSEDEKIEIITSYGSDSDSEPEKNKPPNITPIKTIDDNCPSDEDVGDILQKIQKRVQELKKENNSKSSRTVGISNENSVPTEKVAHGQSGIALIAGYSDSEEEHEESTILPIKPEVSRVSHSTLFPITTPVDIKDFSPENTATIEAKESPQFDNKAFKRKRRIGVALLNTGKKNEGSEQLDNERKGLGFGKDSPINIIKDNVYQNFAKGGVMFVKADVLNPVSPKNETTEQSDEPVKNLNEVNDMYTTLKEKLNFLNVGRPDISPVQVMLIQAEMLFVAMNEGGLKLSYLEKWLSETCSELIKLEKEATPEGWQLQWDRQHKRYFYRNQVTGTSQWEYPTSPAVIGREEHGSDSDAMDISTTPPPEAPYISDSPPPPPAPPEIRCPTPPPPPVIRSGNDCDTISEVNEKHILETPETTAKKSECNGEPLPPGVDLPEVVPFTQETKISSPADPLNSALDSFYSDIAAISSNPTTSPQPTPPPPPDDCDQASMSVEPAKKKKKTKVKLASGLGMKKKGVIQLVEKWKHVQQDYQE